MGVANYGVKPTVAKSDQVPELEVHALDTTELSTCNTIEVEWLKFIPPRAKICFGGGAESPDYKDCDGERVG